MKGELAGLTPARPCCQVSELLGIFFSTRGRVIRTGIGQAAYFPLLRNTVARKVVRLARVMGGIEAKYQAVKSAKQMAFFIEMPIPVSLAFSTRRLPTKVRVLADFLAEAIGDQADRLY